MSIPSQQLVPFQDKTLAEVANSLASFLPNDDLFRAKNVEGSNLRNLLKGFSEEILRIENTINSVAEEFNINTTVSFIEKWETLVGIPGDGCFGSGGTLQERRDRVILKLASQGASTKNEFELLGQKFGINLTVDPACDHACFPVIMPWLFVPDVKTARFSLFVTVLGDLKGVFPVKFPWPFGAKLEIKCLFSKLIPANVELIFRQQSF